MYTSKKFRVRKSEEVIREIQILANYRHRIKKIFLADGNAFILSSKKLLSFLHEINRNFSRIQRISSYALPKDILTKSPEELKEIRQAGLKLLYIGIESGDDELLQLVNKGETFRSTIKGILKAHEAGIDTSIMVINGLGGRNYSRQHATHSAKLINAIDPKFLSTLTLSLPFGQQHFEKRFKGLYIQQSVVELAQELKLFIEHLDVNRTIFRSDHISNNLVLKGVFSKDKDTLLKTIDSTIEQIDGNLYPEAPGIL